MTPPLALRARPVFRVSFLACAVCLGILALAPATAFTLERKVFGDVSVERGEIVEEVSTVVGDVTVEGSVEWRVESGLGDVRVNGPVGGGVRSGFGDIEVEAPVGGGVEAGFGDVYVNAPVAGDVDAGRGDVVLGPGARVGGSLYCGSGRISSSPGVAVECNPMVGTASDFGRSGGEGRGLFGLLGWFLLTLGFAACAVLLAVVSPRPLVASARALEDAPGRSLLLGLASVPAAVVVSVVLALSVVGIPFLLLAAPAYLVFVFFGALVAAYFVGRRILLLTERYRAGDALAAVVGAFTVSALSLIPLLGDLILYALALLGAGAAILALFSRPRRTYTSYEEYVRDRRGS
jgi:hypothetical protein